MTESGVAVAQLESKAESRWPRVSHSQVSAVDQHLTKEVQDASQSEEDAEVQRNRNQHETQKAVEMVYSFFFLHAKYSSDGKGLKFKKKKEESDWEGAQLNPENCLLLQHYLGALITSRNREFSKMKVARV